MKDDFIFETERLRVRVWKHTDAEAAFSIFSDPVVMRTFRNDGWVLKSKEALELVLCEVENSQCFPEHYAITLKSNSRLIGSLSFRELEDDQNRASGEYEITWILARAYWGNGYATESARGFIQYLFGTKLGLRRILARCLPSHLKSRNVAERIGMKFLCTSSLYGSGLLTVYEISNSILEVLL
ncbi:MAG: GNAT family N-acetyltransferase [Armatimonadota bacterium]